MCPALQEKVNLIKLMRNSTDANPQRSPSRHSTSLLTQTAQPVLVLLWPRLTSDCCGFNLLWQQGQRSTNWGWGVGEEESGSPVNALMPLWQTFILSVFMLILFCFKLIVHEYHINIKWKSWKNVYLIFLVVLQTVSEVKPFFLFPIRVSIKKQNWYSLL